MSYGDVRPAITNEPLPTSTSFSLMRYLAPGVTIMPQKKSLVRLSLPSLNSYVEIKDSDILATEQLQLHIGIGKRYLERGINWRLFTQGEERQRTSEHLHGMHGGSLEPPSSSP